MYLAKVKVENSKIPWTITKVHVYFGQIITIHYFPVTIFIFHFFQVNLETLIC